MRRKRGDEIGVVDCKKAMKGCPKNPGNPYGEEFSWIDYSKWTNKKNPKHEPSAWYAEFDDIDHGGHVPYSSGHVNKWRQEELEGCVPDASNTKEKWSLSPVELIMIGELDGHEKGIVLSDVGKKIFRKR